MLQLTRASVCFSNGSAAQKLKTLFRAGKQAGAPARGAPARGASAQGAPALDAFTLWLGRGESWAVLGAKGAGKTTLLRLVAGHIPPTDGHCSVEGHVAAAIRGEEGLIETETGRQMVRLRGKLEGVTEAVLYMREQTAEALAVLGDAFDKPVHTYDASMRARLAISLALAEEPEILLLSNLLEHCGATHAQRYATDIRRRVHAGMTVLMESEDHALLARVCESALLLEEGKLVQLGFFETVYASYMFPLPREGKDSPAKGNMGSWAPLQQAAFSEPLSPSWGELRDRRALPQSVRQAMEEQAITLKRLNDQLTQYARANLAYEEENQRLQLALAAERAKATAAKEQLTRMQQAASEHVRVMHRQFLFLKKKR